MRLYLALVCLALMGLAQAFMPSGTRLVVRWLTRGRRGNSGGGWCCWCRGARDAAPEQCLIGWQVNARSVGHPRWLLTFKHMRH